MSIASDSGQHTQETPGPPVPRSRRVVFLASVLLIVGAGVGIYELASLVGLVYHIAALGARVNSPLIAVNIILRIASAVLMLISGVVGVKIASSVTKTPILLNLGLVTLTLSLVVLLTCIATNRTSVGDVVGVVFPALFIIAIIHGRAR